MKKDIKYMYFIRVVLVLFFGLFLHFSSNVVAQNATPRGTQISDGTSPNVLSSLPFSLLELNSNERGFLMPRMTTAERSEIPKNKLIAGLIIYNTSMGCVEFYNATRQVWMNMCGDIEPAIFTIPNDKCGQIEKNIAGDYIQGVLLDSRKNLISIEVNVSSPGTFDIEAVAYDDTGNANGYTFTTKGVFPTSGNFLLVLKGSGTPKKGYANVNTKDKIKFTLNKKLSTCVANNHVKPDFEPLVAAFDCTKPVRAEATYKIDEPLTSANRLIVSFTVTKPGRGKVYGEVPISGKQTELIQYESVTIDFRVTDVGQVQEVVLSPVYGTGKPTTAGELIGKLKMISKGKNEYDPFAPEDIQTIQGCEFKINVARGIAKYKFKGNAYFDSDFYSKSYSDIVYGPIPYITPSTDMSKGRAAFMFRVYVTLEVEQPGDYKIQTIDKNGVYFYREGIIEKEEIKNGEVTIVLYAKGTSGLDMKENSGNIFVAYDLFKGAVGASPSFSGPTRDVDFVYRPMTVYSIGYNVYSWHPGGARTGIYNGGPTIVRNLNNFSWNGVVRIDGLSFIGLSSLEAARMTNNSQAEITGNTAAFGTNLAKSDIVFIGPQGDAVTLPKNDAAMTSLANSVRSKQIALIYGEGNKDVMASFIDKLDLSGIPSTNLIANNVTTSYFINSASGEQDPRYLIAGTNKHFGGKYGEGSLALKPIRYSTRLSNNRFTISLSNQNYLPIAGTSSNSLTDVFAFVHRVYGFVGVGNANFMGGYGNGTQLNNLEYPVPSVNEIPVPNTATAGTTYNSFFLLNLTHWAIDYAQRNVEYDPLKPKASPSQEEVSNN